MLMFSILKNAKESAPFSRVAVVPILGLIFCALLVLQTLFVVEPRSLRNVNVSGVCGDEFVHNCGPTITAEFCFSPKFSYFGCLRAFSWQFEMSMRDYISSNCLSLASLPTSFTLIGFDLYHCLRFRYMSSSGPDLIGFFSFGSCIVNYILAVSVPYFLFGLLLTPYVVLNLGVVPEWAGQWAFFFVVVVGSPIVEETISHFGGVIPWCVIIGLEAWTYVVALYPQHGLCAILIRGVCLYDHYLRSLLPWHQAVGLHMFFNALACVLVDLHLSCAICLLSVMIQIVILDQNSTRVVCQSTSFSALDIASIARSRLSRWFRIYDFRTFPDLLWAIFDDYYANCPPTYGLRTVDIYQLHSGLWNGHVTIGAIRGQYAHISPTYTSADFTGETFDEVLLRCRDDLIDKLCTEFSVDVQSSVTFDCVTFFVDVWLFVMNMACANTTVHRIALIGSFVTARFRECLQNQFEQFFPDEAVLGMGFKLGKYIRSWIWSPAPSESSDPTIAMWHFVIQKQFNVKTGRIFLPYSLDDLPSDVGFLQYVSHQFSIREGVPPPPLHLIEGFLNHIMDDDFSFAVQIKPIAGFYKHFRVSDASTVEAKEYSRRHINQFYLEKATQLLSGFPMISDLFVSPEFLPQSSDFIELQAFESFSLSGIFDFLSSVAKIGSSKRIVRSVFVVIAFVVTLARNPFSFSWAGFTSVVDDMEGTGFTEKASVIDQVISGLEWLTSTGAAAYNGNASVFDLTAARRWLKATSYYVGYNHPIDDKCFNPVTGIDKSISARQLLENIDALVRVGQALVDSARSNHIVSPVELTNRLSALAHVTNNISAYLRGCAMRRAPFSLLITGPSGCCKSHFLNMVKTVLQLQRGLSINPEYTYNLPADNNFPDGFKSSQHTILIDDAGARIPGPGVVDNGVQGIIKFVNNIPCPMEAAAVEDKGKNFFTGDLLLATSNTDHLFTHANFTYPSAVLRRLPYVIRLKPRERTLSGDLVRIPRASGEDLDSWWSISMERVTADDSGPEPTVKRTQLMVEETDIHVAMRVIGDACRHHFAVQESFMDSVSALSRLPVCEACGCHRSTCACVPSAVCPTCGIYRSICAHQADGRERFAPLDPVVSAEDRVPRRRARVIRGRVLESYDTTIQLLSTTASVFMICRALYVGVLPWLMSLIQPVVGPIWNLIIAIPNVVSSLRGSVSDLRAVTADARRATTTAKHCLVYGAWLLASLGSLIVLLKVMSSVSRPPSNHKYRCQADVAPSNFQKVDGSFPTMSTWNFNRHAPPLSRMSRAARGAAVEGCLRYISNCVGKVSVTKASRTVSTGHFQVLGAPYAGWIVLNKHTVFGPDGDHQPISLQLVRNSRGRNADGLPNSPVSFTVDFSSCQCVRGDGDILYLHIPSYTMSKGIYGYLLESPYPCNPICDLVGFDDDEDLVLGAVEFIPHMWGGIRYPFLRGGTKAGDCGRALVGCVDGCFAVFGFHTSRGEDGFDGTVFGQSTAITKADVDNCLKAAMTAIATVGEPSADCGICLDSEEICPVGEIRPANRHTGTNGEFGSRQNVEFLGRVGELSAYDTNVVSTPFVDAQGIPWFKEWFPTKQKQAPLLSPKAKVNGISVGYLPKKNFLDNISATRQDGWDTAILDRCADGLVNHFSSLINTNIQDDIDHRHGALSYHHSINSIHGMDGLEMLNMRTGFGFPHNTNKMEQFSTFVEDGRTQYALKPAPADQLERLDRAIRSGQAPAFVFRGARKDEPISREKAETRGPRLIFAAPTLLTILIRRYFGLLIRQLYRVRMNSGICVGLNCFNYEWHVLYANLTQLTTRCIAGDFGNFDQRLPAAITQRSLGVLRRVNENIRGSAFDRADTVAMNTLIYILVHPIMLIDTDLYQLFGVNPSGQALTTHTNCVSVLLLLMYVWCRVGYTVEEFFLYVRFATYGDDHVLCVPPRFSKFNYDSIAREMALFSIDYTTFDKSSAVGKDCDDIADIEFLKRRFVHSRVGVIAPLSYDSILRRLYISKKPASGVDPLSHQRDILSSVWRDTLLHVTGAEIRESIERYCIFANISMPDGLFPKLEQYIKDMTPPIFIDGFDSTVASFY